MPRLSSKRKITVESLRAEKEPLIKLLTPWMTEHAVLGDDPHGTGHHWYVNTWAGILRVHPMDDWIACRFEGDLELARKHFGVRSIGSTERLNPYSGKWNWHVWEVVPFRSNGSNYTRRELAALVTVFTVELDTMVLPFNTEAPREPRAGDMYVNGETRRAYRWVAAHWAHEGRQEGST